MKFNFQIVNRAQQGVALVITLILLSVITFMAVTFLVVSRRESEQVNTLSQQNNAKFAATIAFDAAQSQAVAQMLAQGNGYNFNMFVSTNFISTNFATGVGSITNVAYTYGSGALLNQADFLRMMTNLLILPRPPVYITTNKNQTTPDFRFYLDLNRNGYYDPNNTVMVLFDDAGNPVTNIFMGDPEWVGILDHPDLVHSSSNFFIGRYAYIALPIGNSLDFNFMHNQVKRNGVASDGYLRNQGVGSYEINMAGFLNGLQPSNWTYNFYEWGNMGAQSSQFAFDDAASILQYRYNSTYNNLRPLATLYPPAANLAANGYIDYYSTGPLMTNLSSLANPPNNLALVDNTVWSGADNPNQLFTTQDLFNSVPGAFSNRLYAIGLKTNTIDRYTYYQMLSQASVASAPEPYPYPYISKLNLNYVNVGGVSATNFIPWTNALQFFTNAAVRLLRSRPEYTAANLCSNGTVYIPIYPTNFYTPSVHRMLQLAANIYDASTNKTRTAPFDFDYPSVFRPTFGKTGVGTNSIIYINGYTNVEGVAPSDPIFAEPVDLRRAGDVLRFPTGSGPILANVYGIPYVIGAKQGFPNFNSFTVVPVVQVNRLIELVKPALNASLKAPGWQTNISYQIGISNMFGASCWNSYMTNYGRGVSIYATNEMTMTLWLTNDLNQTVLFTTNFTNGYSTLGTPIPAGTWAGSPANPNNSQSSLAQSFKLPIFAGTNWITNMYVTRSGPGLTNIGPANGVYQSTPKNFYPRWSLIMTNRLRVIMQDPTTGRLIDYVQLGGVGEMNGLDSFEDINGDLQNLSFTPSVAPGFYAGPNGKYSLWTTNAINGTNNTPRGIWNQLWISQSVNSVPTSMWLGLTAGQVSAEVSSFLKFLGPGATTLAYQAPFPAFAKYTNNFTWSANDPLVHYVASDLNDLTTYTLANNLLSSTNVSVAPIGVTNVALSPTNLLLGLRQINNFRYLPWNSVAASTRLSLASGNLAFKDPLVFQSDSWQFPTNRFPNIGWLGRVHRGTPWQTLYLKSAPVNELSSNYVSVVNYPNGSGVTNVYTNHPSWQYWSGDSVCWPGSTTNGDAAIMEPTNDWKILDLFTTAPNENASRGQLSVNQSGSAAWAAILDGVITVTNTSSTNLAPLVIDPIVNSNAFMNIFTNIINTRTNYGGNVFTSVGDVLSTPQLTVASPFLNTANPAMLNDAAYERIPQQILSLLRIGTPRYVIYAYGQSLKPADRSIVTSSGPYFGMCTNYQITGEVVTRTVVRFEPTTPGVTGFLPAGPMRPVVESFTVLPPE